MPVLPPISYKEIIKNYRPISSMNLKHKISQQILEN
jgi:hypothetical protein